MSSTSATTLPPIICWSSFIPHDALPFQTHSTVTKALDALSATVQHPLNTREFAVTTDQLDPLHLFRAQFCIPKAKDIAEALAHGNPDSKVDVASELQESVYFCGNSLGLLSKTSQSYVHAELDKWALLGVEGHFAGARPWARIDETPTALSIPVVGAKAENEIAIMNSLSVNLHLALTSFYQPTGQRFKILMESEAFCSDHHVIRSQIELHGRKPEDAIISLTPRAGETYLRTEDIIQRIAAEGESLSLVFLPGVQFYTGQFFDLENIAIATHKAGAYFGVDLAHAVGNVPLKLHDWNVDFAAWCSYKYLNSGPGAIGGFFVHERHHANADLLKLKGWWGQTPSQRFAMKSVHVEKPGAQSYMLSNPAVLPSVCMQGSLEIHNKAGQEKMRMKSMLLTGYLERLLKEVVGAKANDETPPSADATASAAASSSSPASDGAITIRILTPSSPVARGCQLSLLFSTPVRPIHRALVLQGTVTDVREPNVIRVSPTPLYNSFQDVYTFVQQLKKVLDERNAQKQ